MVKNVKGAYDIKQRCESFERAQTAEWTDYQDGAANTDQYVRSRVVVDCRQLHVDVQLDLHPDSERQHRQTWHLHTTAQHTLSTRSVHESVSDLQPVGGPLRLMLTSVTRVCSRRSTCISCNSLIS